MGGEFAEVNEFPWAALLSLNYSGNGTTVRCGGSLISDRFVAESQYHRKLPPFLFRHVVTAAHCLQQYSLSGDTEFIYDDITVTLGRNYQLLCPELRPNL